MIPLCKITQIQDMLNAGISYRKITVMAGVSRGTISRVANGEITNRRRRKTDSNFSRYVDSSPRLLPKRICPTCGIVGYHPCVACRAIDGDNSEKRIARLEADQVNTADLDLKLDEQETNNLRLLVANPNILDAE
jgi:hypothetical protein